MNNKYINLVDEMIFFCIDNNFYNIYQFGLYCAKYKKDWLLEIENNNKLRNQLVHYFSLEVGGLDSEWLNYGKV